MECLPPTVSYHIFMNKYLTPFRLLAHLGVNNIQATIVLSKVGSASALSLRTNSGEKRNMATLNSEHQAKSALQLYNG